MPPPEKKDCPPGTKRRGVRKRKPDARLTHLHTMQTLVHRLHQEVESLKLTRQLLLDRHLQRADQIGGSFERIVREYFEVFRFGIQSDCVAAAVPSMARSQRSQRSPEQFLRSIVDENVDYSGPEPGIDRFIELKKMYSSAFRENTLTLLDVKVFPIEGEMMLGQNTVLVSGWGRYSCYVTPTTIEMLFPHIKTNRVLVTKLLGLHISGVGRYDFVFNTTSHRVIATNVDLNFVPVFMDALKNPNEVALLLNKAHITPEYLISSQAMNGGRLGTQCEDDAPIRPASSRIPMAYLLT